MRGGAFELGPFDSVIFSMILKLPLMIPTNHSSSLRAGLFFCLALLLLVLAPFAVAQDVHHELAAADHDGHEHSDTDLCQWVQHHTAGSLDVDVPRLAFCELVWHRAVPAESVLLSLEYSSVGPSRAPPRR
jgi:hypothetical protein